MNTQEKVLLMAYFIPAAAETDTWRPPKSRR